MSSFLMRLHGQHGWHLHGTSTTPQRGSRNTWTRWIPWIHGGVGFGLNLPNLPTVGSKEIWYQNGNTKPTFVDLFRWFQLVESWKGGSQIHAQRLGYRVRAICLDISWKFVKIQEHVQKPMWTTATKTCSTVHLKHPTFTFRAPRFSAARCSAVRCRSPVQRDRSARFFNNLVLSMGRRLRSFYESLVYCGNPFYNKIMHPSLFKTNHWHIEKNPLKAGIRTAISSQYPPAEFEINERGTPAKVFQQSAKKNCLFCWAPFPLSNQPRFLDGFVHFLPSSRWTPRCRKIFHFFGEVSMQNRHVF